MPRHAWWRDTGVTWRGLARGAIDVVGLAAPPTLARQCRALLCGAAGPNIPHEQPHHLAAVPTIGPGYLDGRIEIRRIRILLSFFYGRIENLISQ